MTKTVFFLLILLFVILPFRRTQVPKNGLMYFADSGTGLADSGTELADSQTELETSLA